MKSDREFLDGIYEKAARYQDLSSEEKPGQKPFYRRFFPAVTTGLTACALFALVIIGKNIGILNNNEIAEEDQASRIRESSDATEIPDELYELSKAQYAADDSLVVSGIIQNIETEDTQIIVRFLTEEIYNGTISSGSVVTITTPRSSIIEGREGIQPGQEAVLCITPSENGESYTVSDAEHIYRYAGEEDGEAVYESLTGIRYRIEDLISP